MLTTSAEYKQAIAAPGRTFDFSVQGLDAETFTSAVAATVSVEGDNLETLNFVVDYPVKQSGSGTPSPSNVRNFQTYSELSAYIRNVNAGIVNEETFNVSLFNVGLVFYGGTYDWANDIITPAWAFETVDGDSVFESIDTITVNGSTLTRVAYATKELLYGNTGSGNAIMLGCRCNIFGTLPRTTSSVALPVAGYLDTDRSTSTVIFYFDNSQVAATQAAVSAWFTANNALLCYRLRATVDYACGEFFSSLLQPRSGITTYGSTLVTAYEAISVTVGNPVEIDISKIYSIQITEEGNDSTSGLLPGQCSRDGCNMKIAKSAMNVFPNHRFTVSVRVDEASDVIPLGRFWTYEATESAEDTMSVTGYSLPQTLEMTVDNTAPKNVSKFIELAEYMGDFHLTNKNLLTLTTISEFPKDITYREMLGHIAGYDGYSIRSNKQGDFELYRYGKNYGDYVLVGNRGVADTWGKPSIFERGLTSDAISTRINSVTYTNGTDVWSSGNGYGFESANPLMTKDQFLNISEYYLGYTYNKATINWRGDPSLQIGDLIGVKINADMVISVPIMSQVFSIDGGIKSTIQSFVAEAADSLMTVSPTDKKIKSVTQVLEDKIATAQSSADAAQTRADDAYTRAGTGITNAATAQSRADSAYTLANTANNTANTVTSTVSNIGTYSRETTSSSVSLTSGTSKMVESITLSAGTYILIGTIGYAANATGVRWNYLGGTKDSTGNNAQTNVSVPACSGYQTFVTNVQVAKPSASTTYYLNGWQNSGSSLACTGHIVAIRIK